ncbi:recombinase family protein [Deinococcus sp. LM3]|nr:recombinase family protein [Deinococcus sp. LM3]
MVIVWKLDRLSRSLKDLLHLMELLGDRGVGFRSLTEPSTPPPRRAE